MLKKIKKFIKNLICPSDIGNMIFDNLEYMIEKIENNPNLTDDQKEELINHYQRTAYSLFEDYKKEVK